jgi:hypothetical protein
MKRADATMIRQQAIWNGTEAESHDLLGSMQRHCACEFDKAGARVRTCGPHEALVHNQRFLDGLLFARRIADRLRAEEWSRASSRTAPA